MSGCKKRDISSKKEIPLGRLLLHFDVLVLTRSWLTGVVFRGGARHVHYEGVIYIHYEGVIYVYHALIMNMSVQQSAKNGSTVLLFQNFIFWSPQE